MELTSAQRKLRRGIEHVDALQLEVADYENREPWEGGVEVERRTPQEFVYRCYGIEHEPVPDHWALLAGEAVQALRAALDHAIYAASGETAGAKFPIFTHPNEYESKVDSYLAGVPEPTSATVRAFQPFEAMPKMPHADRLARLRTLSNTDKHKTLATVLSLVDFETIEVGPGVDTEWLEVANGKALGPEKAHLSTFIASSASVFLTPDSVTPSFDIRVLVEGLAPKALRGIAQHVSRVVHALETGEMASPFERRSS